MRFHAATTLFVVLIALTNTANADILNSVKNFFGIGDNGNAPAPAPSAFAPEPQYALAPGLDDYGQLKLLLVNASGPIVYKTAQAAAYLYNQSISDATLTSKSQTVPLANNSGTLLASYDNTSLVLAFQASDNLTSQLLNSTGSQSQQPFYLAQILPTSTVLSSIEGPFESLLNGTNGVSLASVIANITGGQNPFRIVTTGYGAGGGFAQVAAVWASVTYTSTHIRSVSFGTPAIGNNKFAFAFQQFVDLGYLWAYNGSALVNTIMRTTDNSTTGVVVNGKYSMTDYVQAVIDAGAFAISNGSITASPGIGYEQANSTAALPTAKGLLAAIPGTYEELSGNSAPTPSYEIPLSPLIAETLDAPAPAGAADCPLILCKVRPAVESACGDYNVSTGIPILNALPGAEQVTAPGVDTNVFIDFDADTRTALLSWRGSITEQDWLQDAKLILRDYEYSLPSNIAPIFPGLEVHTGFQQQFKAVAIVPNTSSLDVGATLDSQMNGMMPERVICTGHSLGAALASLCSVWAATRWPGADVRGVTIGQPFTGNQVFVDAYRTLVGREYRIVHQYDIVPSLPPTDDYRHVGLGIWELNNQVQVRDRPQYPLDKLNWQDHSCFNYSNTLNVASNVTILSNSTAEVPQAVSS